jgi:hypothetical protein
VRAELAACRVERDRLRLVLDTERAHAVARQEMMRAERETIARRAFAAERKATESARELAAIRATLSWRLTRPLRAVRRRMRRS